MRTRISIYLGVIVLALGTTSYAGQINWAEFATAAQSSTLFGATADRAIDGNRDGRFNNGSVSMTGYGNSWYELDLGLNRDIDKLSFFNISDACCTNLLRDMQISVLDSDRTVRFSDYYFDGFAAAPHRFNLFLGDDLYGRFIRIDRLVEGNLAFAEIEVYGDDGLVDDPPVDDPPVDDPPVDDPPVDDPPVDDPPVDDPPVDDPPVDDPPVDDPPVEDPPVDDPPVDDPPVDDPPVDDPPVDDPPVDDPPVDDPPVDDPPVDDPPVDDPPVDDPPVDDPPVDDPPGDDPVQPVPEPGAGLVYLLGLAIGARRLGRRRDA